MAWQRNLSPVPGEAPGTFSAPIVLLTSTFPGTPVAVADLDGDGDEDILARRVNNFADPTLFYVKNLSAAPDNAPGTFGTTLHEISDGYRSNLRVQIVDLDEDGDNDILFSAFSDRLAIQYRFSRARQASIKMLGGG